MRVVHIISNLNLGGAETTLFQLVVHNHQDHSIVVSLQDDGVYGERLRQAGVDVVSLGMPKGRVNFAGAKELFLLLRKTNPDAIQTWMYHSDLFGGMVARLAGKNRVCWGIHHSNLNKDANSSVLLFLVKLCAVMSRVIPKRIISCSNKSTQVHRAKGYADSKFRTVSNGYDLSQFTFNEQSRISNRQRWSIDGEVLLGMVGRWDPQKDHQNLIQAISLLNANVTGQPTRCVLVGKGMSIDNHELMQLLDQYDAQRFFILDGLSNEVAGIMSAIDIHILSSKGEAFPNVVAEAMACKTPCVVTDVGDAKEIVAQTGWVAEPENPDSLSKAIGLAVQAAGTRESWQKRREQCVSRIEQHYEISMIVEQYREVWTQLHA